VCVLFSKERRGWVNEKEKEKLGKEEEEVLSVFACVTAE